MERYFDLILHMVSGAGPKTIRPLIGHFGNAENILRASRSELQHIAKSSALAVGLAGALENKVLVKRAEAEIAFADKYQISMVSYGQPGYPARLMQTQDSPFLLFKKGPADLDHPRMISIVGTRHATAYGKTVCEQFIYDLVSCGIMVVSGLAWGIDIAAHRASLQHEIPTIGVLAHGLSHLYPPEHRQTAQEMLGTGALVTEFLNDQKAEKGNFPKRNRIIAGLSDATLLIEAGLGGGALITAGIANSYDRQVFAFPGRSTDLWSAGCNELIRDQEAQLITSAADFIRQMNWDLRLAEKRTSALGLSDPLEIRLMEFVLSRQLVRLDELASEFIHISARLPALLLELELKGRLRQLPGKRFEAC